MAAVEQKKKKNKEKEKEKNMLKKIQQKTFKKNPQNKSAWRHDTSDSRESWEVSAQTRVKVES